LRHFGPELKAEWLSIGPPDFSNGEMRSGETYNPFQASAILFTKICPQIHLLHL
jgi:hypothetical protein